MNSLVVTVLLFFGVASCAVIPKGLVPLSDGRIYGGKNAKLGQFPYAASLRWNGLHRCGGVLYRDNAIVTAAHCVYERDPVDMEVVVGLIIRNMGGQERWVVGHVTHPGFNPSTFTNDVAVVKLEYPVQYTDTVKPIALANLGEELEANTKVTVCGWGTYNDEGYLPEGLQYVDLRVIDHVQCKAAYKDLNTVDDNMICAGTKKGGKDACNGDSGGPLVEGDKVYGLVSWGNDCGSPLYPGVYIKVGAYRDWISGQFV